MIYMAVDGWRVRLYVPSGDYWAEWNGYRSRLDAEAVERRLIRTLAREAGAQQQLRLFGG